MATNATLANGPGKKVAAILETPVPVTTANINQTVIKDGFLTPGRDLHGYVRPVLHEVRHQVGCESVSAGRPEAPRRTLFQRRE